MLQEHMVNVKVITDETGLQFKVTLSTELPLFKCTVAGHPEIGTITEYKKEKLFYVNPKRATKRIRRELRKAQKRYNKILAVRNTKFPYNPRVNLGHKL